MRTAWPAAIFWAVTLTVIFWAWNAAKRRRSEARTRMIQDETADWIFQAERAKTIEDKTAQRGRTVDQLEDRIGAAPETPRHATQTPRDTAENSS